MATLDFGGAWVTTAAGRDLTSADLTVALNGVVVVNSSRVALSQHPGREGVYHLVLVTAAFSEDLTVSFAAGALVSPAHGPLVAFSESVALVDCTLPFVAQASVMEPSGYVCAPGAITCPADGLWRAAFVLDIDFSELVFRADEGPITDDSVEIYTVGGVATVVGTYVVQRADPARRRRLDEAVGVMRLSVAVELSAGATGFEVVKVRPREGAIWDGSHAWVVSSQTADVVTAAGNVLEPFSSALSSSETAPSSPLDVAIPLICATGVAVALLAAFFICRRQGRCRKNRGRVAPRAWASWGSRRGLGLDATTRGSALHKQKTNLRGKPASAEALAIAKHYEWLRVKEPLVESTGRWIDTLADAAVHTLRGAQPPCALAPAVLKCAHVVQSKLQGGRASDDVGALQALRALLRNGPPPFPESLVKAAAGLAVEGTDAKLDKEKAKSGKFGEVEAAIALKQVLMSERAVPTAVALAMGDVAPPPVHLGDSGVADTALKQQLANLLQEREWYAYALSAVRSNLVPACLAAFSGMGIKQPPVVTDAGAVALVCTMIEAHVHLAETQRKAEACTHRALEVPYRGFDNVRGGGISVLDVDGEVGTACRRIHGKLVARKLKAADLVTFAGRLPSTESIATAAHSPQPLLRSGSSAIEVGGFSQRRSTRIVAPSEAPVNLCRTSSHGSVWGAQSTRASVRLSEVAGDTHHGSAGVLSSFGASVRHLWVQGAAAPRAGNGAAPGRNNERLAPLTTSPASRLPPLRSSSGGGVGYVTRLPLGSPRGPMPAKDAPPATSEFHCEV